MNSLLKATHTGEITIGERQIGCAVLEDGTRILTATGLFNAFDRPRKGEVRLEGIPSIVGAKNLEFLITDNFKNKSIPIQYILKDGGKEKSGYDANFLIEIAELYIKAEELGILKESQKKIFRESVSVLSSFAKIGITALIDEATGYQKFRKENELQLLLNAYMSEDLLKWTKKFPDKFYSELYRIYNKTQNEDPNKRGSWIAILTKKFVYDLFPDEVMEKIKERNPEVIKKGEAKGRKYKHHQFLSEEIGLRELDHTLSKLLGVMSLSNTPEELKKNYKIAFAEELKKKETQKTLELEFIN